MFVIGKIDISFSTANRELRCSHRFKVVVTVIIAKVLNDNHVNFNIYMSTTHLSLSLSVSLIPPHSHFSLLPGFLPTRMPP